MENQQTERQQIESAETERDSRNRQQKERKLSIITNTHIREVSRERSQQRNNRGERKLTFQT